MEFMHSRFRSLNNLGYLIEKKVVEIKLGFQNREGSD
jgi:hypothetical protein